MVFFSYSADYRLQAIHYRYVFQNRYQPRPLIPSQITFLPNLIGIFNDWYFFKETYSNESACAFEESPCAVSCNRFHIRQYQTIQLSHYPNQWFLRLHSRTNLILIPLLIRLHPLLYFSKRSPFLSKMFAVAEGKFGIN